jgi:diguanylate cyclase (GGDEF)-like protein
VERAPQRGGGRAALICGLIGATWLGAHALGLLGPFDSLTFAAVAAGATGAVTYGIWKHRPRPRWVWGFGLVSMLLFFVGGVLREVFGTLGDLSSDREWYPEPFSMLGYVALGVSLFAVARSHLGDRWNDRVATLDALIAGLAALAVAWIFLITPALEQESMPFGARVALALYPAFSAFLVTAGFRIGFAAEQHPPIAFRIWMCALVAMLVGDTFYMLVELHFMSYERWVDAPYGLAWVLIATAALHPTMRRVTEPVSVAVATPRRGLVLVAIAVCVPGFVMLAQPDTQAMNRVAVAAIVLVLMGAAGLRVFWALRDHADSESRLTHQATHDTLTDLPNRVQLEAELLELLRDRGPDDLPLAVLFLDLDRFKLVNDTLGHSTGDELLRAVANRLRNNVRPNDLVMRIGGDEFVIVLPTVRDEHEAREIAERTRLTFGTPFKAGAAEIPISTSIGVTMAGGAWPVNDAETLLREADTAMYAAKENGGDYAVTFDKAMHDRVIRRLALEGEIRLAVNRDELSVHYQPIVQVTDGRMTGLEALLRWEHPVLGQVPPADFIPVCEEIGYIVELGGWVIDEAVGQLAALRAQYPHSDQLSMAINVSARQLRDERLCDHVARAMVKYNLPASALCIEITESLLVENLSAIADTLTTLRGFGVRIAIDDFGTGYSSLAYLRRLPVDEIKIDRQFISNLGQDRSDDSLVAAILAMANSLGYTSVAEGVETDLQLSRLIELGCEHAQGFAFATPSPAEELPEMVERLGLAAAPRLRVVRDLA